MSTIVGVNLADKQKFTQDAIKDLLDQNQTFCKDIGKLAKIGTEFAIKTIPQLKSLNKPFVSDVVAEFAEVQATKLCNTYMKNLDSGKYCPVPLTLNQKDIAVKLLNGKADENYLKMCKPEDVKLAAKSVEAFTESNDYRSINRQTENRVIATINSDDFVVPAKEMATFEANLDLDTLKDQINSIQAKQTTTFLTELNAQLPSMLPIMIARLAMGEDIKYAA
jgi:hypothetical protein